MVGRSSSWCWLAGPGVLRVLPGDPGQPHGAQVYSPAELKTIQEVATLAIFAVFSVAYLGEKVTADHAVGFGLIALGAICVFKGPF